MRVVVTLQAKLDLARERDNYERQREGLGTRFLDEMEAILGHLARRPLSFPQFVGEPSRRALGKRFPFMVLFYVDGAVIYVTAVVHQHADPEGYRRG